MCIVFTSDVARVILEGEELMYKLNYKFLLSLLLNAFTYRMANAIFFTIGTYVNVI